MEMLMDFLKLAMLEIFILWIIVVIFAVRPPMQEDKQ